MEKRNWTTPRVELVQFGANEYISSCGGLYNLFCDVIGVIYLNTTGKKFDGLQYGANNGMASAIAFWQAFDIQDTSQPRENYNYDAFYDYVDNRAQSDMIWGSYVSQYDQIMNTTSRVDTCDASYQFTASEIENMRTGYVVNDDGTFEVLIWHNPNETNSFHASYYDSRFDNAARS